MKNDVFPLDGDWMLYTAENKDISPSLLSAACARELENTGLSAIPGRVPGNFELDFERAGLLPELFFGENILKTQELENRHLWYTRSFDSPFSGGADTFLCFDGIDTFADIYLNGEKIGGADNMLIAHEFNAPNLRAGKNEVTVHISPAVLEARKTDLEAGSSSSLPYNWDSLGIRKAPYMFGWDIMPRAVSGGIWKSVRLEKRPPERIEELYLYTSSTSHTSAGVRFYYKLSVAGDFISDYALKLSGVCKDSVFTYLFPLWHTEGTLGFHIENPYLWWPRDMGDPDLYTVKAELCRNGETIAKNAFFSAC